MKHRILTIILMMSALWTSYRCFAYDFEVNGIFYTITSFDDYLVKIDGFSDSTSGIVDIPSTVTYNTRTFTINQISSAQGGSIETTIIPTTVKTIDRYAYFNTKIQYIVIPNSISAIEEGTFKGCTELKSIEISSNVSNIGRYAFANCVNLKKVIWQPNESSRIGGCAFMNCQSLTAFTIPANVIRTGGEYSYGILYQDEGAFSNCSKLDSLIIEDSDSRTLTFGYFEDMDDPSWNNKGEFYGCPIKYVYWGKSCKYVDSRYRSAPELNPSYVVIGDKVMSSTYICMGKDSVVIGKSLKHVRSSGVKQIKIRQTTPPTADNFSNYAYLNTIVYVPKGSKSVYESADIWKNFFNIQEFDFDDIEVEVKKCAKPTINYSNGKLSFVCETEDAICQASITDTDIKTYSGNEIQLGVTYVINVYATKAGYENSETVTATLCWIEQQPMMEGVTNNISQIPAKAMLIHCQGGMLTIYGVDEGSDIAVYTVSGQMVGSIRANGNQAVLTTNIKKGEVAIIKIGEKSVKVVMQ